MNGNSKWVAIDIKINPCHLKRFKSNQQNNEFIAALMAIEWVTEWLNGRIQQCGILITFK